MGYKLHLVQSQVKSTDRALYLAVLPSKGPTIPEWSTQKTMITSLGFALAQFRLASYSLTLLSIFTPRAFLLFVCFVVTAKLK